MDVSFIGDVPAVGGGDRQVEMHRVGAVTDRSRRGIHLFRHLPEHFDGGGSGSHRIGHLIGLVWLVREVVLLVGHSPSRVAEVRAVRAGMDSGTVGIELEIAVGSVHEIGVAVDAMQCCRSGGQFERCQP